MQANCGTPGGVGAALRGRAGVGKAWTSVVAAQYRIAPPWIGPIIGAFNREVTTVTALCNPISLRVYWEDTDAGGVVFYANYLKYFERARTEWLRRCGVQQRTLQQTQDCIFVVAEVSLRYLAPARLDDLLTVSVQPTEWGRASLLLQQQVWREHSLLAEGQVRIACVRATDLRACRIPPATLAQLAAGQVPVPLGSRGGAAGDPA